MALLFGVWFMSNTAILRAPGAPVRLLQDASVRWTHRAAAPVGHIMPFPTASRATGVLVTMAEGKVRLVGPNGIARMEVSMDHRADVGAVCGVLRPGEEARIVAMDVTGSVYCFTSRGRRVWRYARSSRSGGFRAPVIADVDGDGSREILVSDSRGHLLCLDAGGRPRLDIRAGSYRVSMASVITRGKDGPPRLLVFANDAGDVYCITSEGSLVWAVRPGGRFGRSLPIVVPGVRSDPPLVLLGTSFVDPRPGLVALAADTGKVCWRAPTEAQTYQSTVVLPTDDGHTHIVFGDKNTRLYCVDLRGKRIWQTSLEGRGIFHAPAVLRCKNGGTVLIQPVRSSGDGPALFAVDAEGRVLDCLSLAGGAAASPVLCRFEAETISLVSLSGTGEIQRRDLQAPCAGGDILVPGQPIPRIRQCKVEVPKRRVELAMELGRGLLGTNLVPLEPPHAATHVAVTMREPGGTRRTDLHNLSYLRAQARQAGGPLQVPVWLGGPGVYDGEVQWTGSHGTSISGTAGFAVEVRRALEADSLDQRRFENDLTKTATGYRPAVRLAAALRTSIGCRWRRVKATLDATEAEELRRMRKEAAELVRALVQLRPVGDIMVVQDPNPWSPLDRVRALRLAAEPDALSVEMVGNEQEVVGALLVNLQEHSCTVRLAAGDCRCSDGSTRPGRDVITLREPLLVRSSTTGRLVEDPLPLLGEASAVVLQPGEIRRLWLTVNSRTLSAGTHRITLLVGDIASETKPAKVTLTIRVSRVRLPDRLRYRHCNWLSPAGIQDETTRELVIADALAHGTSVFVVPPPIVQVDSNGEVLALHGGVHDTLATRLAGRAFLLIGGLPAIRWPEGTVPTDDASEHAFRNVLRAYAKHMESLGFPSTEYALYLMDEPGLTGPDASFQSFVAQVRRVKQALQTMPIYANPAGGARAEILMPLVGLVDIWCPDMHLYKTDPTRLEPVFRSGREWWHYEAPADQRNLDPLGFYRMQPWMAFRHGMQGAGYWVHSYDPYWFDEPGTSSEYGAVYMTDGRPVPTKRWEATREGIEDYELLSMVSDRARASDASAAAEARTVLTEAVEYVTTGQWETSDIGRQTEPVCPDYTRWMGYRHRLIALLERLWDH